MTDPLRATRARLVLAAIVTLALVWLLWPYVGAIFWSVVLAIVFAPLYRALLRVMRGRKTPAGVVTLLAIVLGVGIPLTLLAAALLRQANALYRDVAARRIDVGAYAQHIADAMPAWAHGALEASGLDWEWARDRLSASAL
jgi:predicted PurR-regulated permease PerM